MDSKTIVVRDHGKELPITFDSCILYHGPDRIAGLSLGFRLMHLALNDLCEGKVPERSKIIVKSAFPGPGFRDAVEMISRAVTQNRFSIVESEIVDGPDGVVGKMFFEVCYEDKCAQYVLMDGALTPEIIAAGRRALRKDATEEAKQIWENYKKTVSDAVWSLDEKILFPRVK